MRLPPPTILLALAATLLTSCASANKSRLRDALKRDEPPEDFVLAVTVYPPSPDAPGAPANAAAARRRGPARFVLEPDWILRAYFGPNISENLFPGQTRQLTHDQVQRLWWELRDSGLVEGPLSPRPGTPTPAPGGAVISYAIDGVRNMLAPTPADRPPGSRIVDRLTELAWARP